MYSAVLYGSTVLIWGTVWFAISFQIGDVSPLTSVFYRIFLSAMILVAYCLAKRKNMIFSLADHAWMSLQGFTLFSVNYWLFYVTTQYLESGLVSVIFSSIVFMNMLNGAFFLNGRISSQKLVGITVGLTGMALLFYGDLTSLNFDAERVRAVLICLVATYLVSIGNIVSARNQLKGIPVAQSNMYGMIYGSAFILLISLASGNVFTIELTTEYLLSLAYLSLVCTVLAFGCYLTLIGRIGADKAAYATLLFPIVAMVLSTLFENYQWSESAYAGVVLSLLGNWLILERSTVSSRFKS